MAKLKQLPALRIFISSPGDVKDERKIANEVIEQVANKPALRDRVSCHVVAWDKPGASAPLLATMTPQEAINQGMPRPSDCDITVVILWSRMGTPFTLAGQEYLSGTHWEYQDALRSEKTEVIVYRRTESPVVALDDQALDEQRTQYQRVVAFFDQLERDHVGFNQYLTTDEFREKFESHLESLVDQILKRATQVEATPESFASGPLGSRSFVDDTVQRVVDQLNRNHQQLGTDTLPLNNLIPELDELFNRKTFRHESVAACREQSWDKRLHSSLQTLEVLKAYQRNVRVEGTTAQYATYREMIAAVDRYSHELAVTMFEPDVETSRVLPFVGTEEFYAYLESVATRKKIPERPGSSTLLDVPDSPDQHRENAIALFDSLFKQFV